MGQCMSSGGAATQSTRAGAAAAPSKDTALVLMPSGEMREYPRPTTAARVLEDASDSDSGDWFLCDADGMGFEGAVPALRPAESLRPGQIYFVLPASARRKGLTREEIAALAVRASAALSSRATAGSAAPGKRRRGAVVAPLVFAPPSEEDEQREEAFAAACKAAAAPPVRRPAPRVRSGKRIERFASDLTAIPECETTSE